MQIPGKQKTAFARMNRHVARKRGIFFNNLILLGFDTASMSRRHNIKFDKNMFMVPNKKAFEVVSFFLFSKLSAVTRGKAASGKDYSIIWPLLDKDQERTFRKTCCAHLANISKESEIKFPRILQSVLMSPGGEKFYRLYLAFSTHVVHKCVVKMKMTECLYSPKPSPQSLRNAIECLKLSTISSQREFKATQEISWKKFQILQKFSKDLVCYYRHIKQSFTAKRCNYKEKLKNISSILCSENEAPENLEIEEIKNRVTSYEDKVKSQWKVLNNALSKDEEFWNKIYIELDENVEKYHLDGSKYKIEVPALIMKECSEKLEQIGFTSLEEDGQLSITNFLKLCVIFFELYLQKCQEAGTIKSLQLCPNEGDVLNITEDLNFIKSYNKNLVNEVIPDLEQGIEILKRSLFTDHLVEASHHIKAKFPTASPVISFTPSNQRNRTVFPEASLIAPSPTNIHLYENSEEEMSPCASICQKQYPSIKPSPLVMDPLKNVDVNESMKWSDEINNSMFNGAISFTPDDENSRRDSDVFFQDGKRSSIDEYSMLLRRKSVAQSFLDSFFNDYESFINSKLPTIANEKTSDGNSSFKMRESWIEEDSLTSVTLPSVPILD